VKKPELIMQTACSSNVKCGIGKDTLGVHKPSLAERRWGGGKRQAIRYLRKKTATKATRKLRKGPKTGVHTRKNRKGKGRKVSGAQRG